MESFRDSKSANPGVSTWTKSTNRSTKPKGESSPTTNKRQKCAGGNGPIRPKRRKPGPQFHPGQGRAWHWDSEDKRNHRDVPITPISKTPAFVKGVIKDKVLSPDEVVSFAAAA
jgi:hypothetical protein